MSNMCYNNSAHFYFMCPLLTLCVPLKCYELAKNCHIDKIFSIDAVDCKKNVRIVFIELKALINVFRKKTPFKKTAKLDGHIKRDWDT